MESHLRCGKDRVSVYLAPAAQYIEVDLPRKSHALECGHVIRCWFQHAWICRHDEGRIFLAFASDPDPNGERKHGLYELRAARESHRLSHSRGRHSYRFRFIQDCARRDILRLWGADGNSLVVSRKGDIWGLSWTKVLAQAGPRSKSPSNDFITMSAPRPE